MAKFLKPSRLDIDPNSTTAAKEWKHWLCTFENFIQECGTGENAPDKLKFLINCTSSTVFDFIEDCTTYEEAKQVLQELYAKPKNEIFACYLLSTRRQHSGESLTEFLQELKNLSKDCNFEAVSAEKYREEMIRDSFINGISSPLIRQRLLENKTLDLQTAFAQASAFDLAQRNSEAYTLSVSQPRPFSAATISSDRDDQSLPELPHPDLPTDVDSVPLATAYPSKTKKKCCFFCGGTLHKRTSCPARNATCNNCGKKGHYAKVCRSKGSATVATIFKPSLCAMTAAVPGSLSRAAAHVYINGQQLSALVDSCSSESFISDEVVHKLSLPFTSAWKDISMAQTTLSTNSIGYCIVDVTLKGNNYPSTHLSILKNLCSDIILGQDFQSRHQSVIIDYNGPKPDLQLSNDTVCGLTAASVEEPSLFPNLSGSCKPIAVKSRQYSTSDREFIDQEIQRLLSEGIIEPSVSPWRAQVVVAKDLQNRHKKQLCVDYSNTINIYTELDAYPVPRIDGIVNKLSKYQVFSTFDVKSAYHQIKIKESDKIYTGFEANGRLYQFTRIPFGVKNGVAAFQRKMDGIVEEDNLEGTFPYLDNVLIGGDNQEDHDLKVNKFLESVARRGLTINDLKTVKSVTSLNTLGYCIGNGIIKPDPENLRALQELPPPENLPSLRRA